MVFRTGWLLKKSGGKEGKTSFGNALAKWDRRYIVVEDSKLTYFKRERDAAPAGTLELAEAVITAGIGLTFDVATRGGRTLTLKADSDESREAWIAALLQASAPPRPTRPAMPPTASLKAGAVIDVPAEETTFHSEDEAPDSESTATGGASTSSSPLPNNPPPPVRIPSQRSFGALSIDSRGSVESADLSTAIQQSEDLGQSHRFLPRLQAFLRARLRCVLRTSTQRARQCQPRKARWRVRWRRAGDDKLQWRLT